MAGYIAKVCLDKFNCESCRKEITVESQLEDLNELLILYRSYNLKEGLSPLKTPSPAMVAVTNIILSLFAERFPEVQHHKGVKSILTEEVTRRIYKTCGRDWFKAGSDCSTHREFIVDYCTKLKILKTIVWMSRDVRMSRNRECLVKASNVSQKIKVLSNQ